MTARSFEGVRQLDHIMDLFFGRRLGGHQKRDLANKIDEYLDYRIGATLNGQVQEQNPQATEDTASTGQESQDQEEVLEPDDLEADDPDNTPHPSVGDRDPNIFYEMKAKTLAALMGVEVSGD